jgi:hypothetical protein
MCDDAARRADAGPGRDYRHEAELIVIANPDAAAGICAAAR